MPRTAKIKEWIDERRDLLATMKDWWRGRRATEDSLRANLAGRA